MEEYALTQENIDRLGLTDAMPGELATYSEMRALGIIPDAAPAAAPVAVASPAASQSFDFANFDMPQPDFGYLTDPYANLTKTQKRMLAFAAIKDAGMALQGKEGTSYETMMADITTRADMARKAKAAQQQQATMALALRGGLSNLTPEQAMQMVLMGFPAELLSFAMGQQEAREATQTSIADKETTIRLIDDLINHPALNKVLGAEGWVRGFFGEAGEALQPEFADLKARVGQLQGGVFLEAFESLKGGGQITQIEGEKASAARARLSTAQDEDTFRKALREYRFYIEQGLARLKGENIPPDTFYEDQGQSDPLGIRN